MSDTNKLQQIMGCFRVMNGGLTCLCKPISNLQPLQTNLSTVFCPVSVLIYLRTAMLVQANFQLYTVSYSQAQCCRPRQCRQTFATNESSFQLALSDVDLLHWSLLLHITAIGYMYCINCKLDSTEMGWILFRYWKPQGVLVAGI